MIYFCYMYKYFSFLLLFTILVSFTIDKSRSIHQFVVEDIQGQPFDFAQLKGKKIMVVNTASKCGLTPQYEKLEALYRDYKSSGFVIIAFPANDFMQQEPGSNEEIASFCKTQYDVTFPVMSKISVKGKGMADVYRFLTQKKWNGCSDSKVKWNFQKYLLNEEGKLEKVLPPSTLPDDPEIIAWIKG